MNRPPGEPVTLVWDEKERRYVQPSAPVVAPAPVPPPAKVEDSLSVGQIVSAGLALGAFINAIWPEPDEKKKKLPPRRAARRKKG